MKRDDHFCRNGRLVRFCNGYFIRLGSYFISFLLSKNSKVVSFLIPITAFNLVKNHSTTRWLYVVHSCLFFRSYCKFKPSKFSKTYLLNARWTPKHEKSLVNLDDVDSLPVIFTVAKLHVE